MLTAIVGINWGDEGKGRMVDLLSADYDVICRYQGGNNAGHTVINEQGKFILNLLPSGIFHENAINVMGGGMVIDIEHLVGEIAALKAGGIAITPKNLKISDKAFICLPYHKQQDILEEERLKDKKYGSTRRGIAPVYGDKYMKKGLRMGDLQNPNTIKQKLLDILEWKDIILSGYSTTAIEKSIVLNWLLEFGKEVQPYIIDTTPFLQTAVDEGKKIMFEAQLGALRDIDYGIYPYTSSSQTLAAYATTGSGLPGVQLNKVIGVMKAYSSCVGEGPFTVEMFGDEANTLREAGGEYGAATSRPRRVGAFDVPASRYGVQVQGATELALTKLDVISYMEKIPVCVAYEIDEVQTKQFPMGDALVKAKPVYEYLDGWQSDISQCRNKASLPAAAINYVNYIENAVNCPIKYVSVGAGREDYLMF